MWKKFILFSCSGTVDFILSFIIFIMVWLFLRIFYSIILIRFALDLNSGIISFTDDLLEYNVYSSIFIFFYLAIFIFLIFLK